MAQDSIVSLDVLSAPQSPAANLMGFTESEILKPESPTDFMTNIKTASGGFSTVPNSLAMDFRLKNFLRPTENNSFSDYIKTTNKEGKSDVWNNVQQTAIVSIGYQNYSALNDSLRTGQGFGLGFKVSLLRGKELDAKFKRHYDSLMAKQSKLGLSGAALQKEWKASSEYQLLRSENIAAIKSGNTERQKIIEAKIDEAQDAFVEKVNTANSAEYDKIRGIVEKMEFKTYGFVWDVAGGAVLNFPTSNFDYSIGGSSGLWTTVGYESKNGLSFLGLGRALYNANVSYTNTSGLLDTANVANYDLGVRLLYEHPGKSFSLSAEGIYRGSFGNAYDPMYRLTFNVGYEIYRNMKLTFMFGRDYDGLVTREGTVISAIQFLAGFGSKKNLKR
jgi:hypothetical protein